MPARKLHGSWWADFSFKDKRYRKRSPANSRDGARDFELTLRRRLACGEDINANGVARAELEFGTFAAKWFEDYAVPNNKPSEQKAKKYIIERSLVPFFGRIAVDRISIGDVERYKLNEKRNCASNKTVNNKLAVLRKCLVCAYEWHDLEGAPPKIKPLKVTQTRPEFLSTEESDELLGHAKGQLREMILLALRSGMRQGEIRGLQWESINWEHRQLTVRHSLCDYSKTLTTPKSNRERTVPLVDEVYELLAARRENSGYVFANMYGCPFSGNVLLKKLKRIQKRAGLREIGWHTLRHSFATQLSANRVSLRVVQELLGHSTVTMTMRYAHVAPDHLRDAIQTLGSVTAGPASLGNLASTGSLPA